MVSTQIPPAHRSGCTCKRCASGERNRFFKGKMMKAPEFDMEQRYGIERRRLLTQAIAGWGLVRGLAIEGKRPLPGHEMPPEPEPAPFRVSPGLALDPHGREIVLTCSTTLGADNTFLVGDGCELRSVDKLQSGRYVLAIHYAERLLGDAALPADCCDTKTEKNYVCETVLFSLRKQDCEECPCGERPCPSPCECCGRHTRHCGCDERSRNSCLCEWTLEAKAPACPGKPCTWRGYELYPQDGVDLACVKVCKPCDDCRPLEGWIADDCTPRRIVKNNDLLYDLIRGCDLTRIKCLSWGEWHRRKERVPWDEFASKIYGETTDCRDVKTGFAVEFSGPVLAETVRADCFSIQFTVGDGDEWRGWYLTRSVPITRILKPHHPGDPLETTRCVTLCVHPHWCEKLTCDESKVRAHGARVLIEVRGDFILDCHGQPVDANARGFALRKEPGKPVRPSGNGKPGGTLASTFTVERAPRAPKPPSEDENPLLTFDEE